VHTLLRDICGKNVLAASNVFGLMIDKQLVIEPEGADVARSSFGILAKAPLFEL
jgi:hypothetical protein